MSHALIALIILAATLFLFATELLPAPVTAILSSLVMCLCGITTPQEFTGGFSNPVTLFCFGIAVVGSALVETGCAMQLGQKIISHFCMQEKRILIVLISLTAVFSMFLSNTSVVVIFMSIATAIAASSNGAVTKKHTFMAIGIAAVAGGGCTLIGSTTQMSINALLPEYGIEALSMFTLFGPGIGVVGLLIFYYSFIGYRRQQVYFDFPELPTVTPPQGSPVSAEKSAGVKLAQIRMFFPLLVLVLCIALTILEWKSIAVIGMLGAMLVVISRSISVKRMWEMTDWNTLGVIAGGVGMASGIRNSGVCDVIAEKTISLLGDGSPALLYFAIFVLLATVMTNIMTNISTALILTPIVISIATAMGFQPLPFVIGVIWGANMPFSTPIGASVITMTMQGGYRFKDYVRVGLPYNIMAAISVIVLTPVFYPLVG